jgi:sodium-dependent dicarboxylate transporter 2/3/5
MLGLMSVTALFSMWMSNTAAHSDDDYSCGADVDANSARRPLRKALMLSVPFAANIGGMGTPIASPPNAVAIGFLRTRGI